jgi:hypothetical protein
LSFSNGIQAGAFSAAPSTQPPAARPVLSVDRLTPLA